MQQILITGATGFIGGHLAESLARRGDRVRCLVRDPERAQRLRDLDVELITGDVTRPETLRDAVEGTDVVYHAAGLLAAMSGEKMLQVNGEGVGNVAKACADLSNPPVLVVLSSLAAAGPVPRGEVRDETTPLAPISLYGQTKREGELAVVPWANRVPATILRPGVVFGPRSQDLRPMLSTIYRLRFHPVPGWRCPPLSYIHVDDLVNVMIQASERGLRVASDQGESNDSTRGFYFVGDDEHPDWARFGRMFAMALNRPYAPVVRLFDPLPWCLGVGSEWLGRVRGRAALLNMDKMREARATSWECSSARAARELDFQLPRTLSERVRETADWFRENGWL